MTHATRPSLVNVYFVAAIGSFFGAVYALLGEAAPPVIGLFNQFASVFAVGLWFRRYLAWAQQRVPFDFGLFFVVGWSVLIPVYALRIHGARGWPLVGALLALAAAPSIVVALVQAFASAPVP